MVNDQASADVRGVRTGKDAEVLNGDGQRLARIDQFQSQVNFNNVQYNPLGCTVDMEAPNTVAVTVTFEELVIEDEQFLKDVFEYMGTGTLPDWTMYGVLHGEGDVEERVMYEKLVPSGSIDLQNFTVGDVIKRSWSLHSNAVPKLMSELTFNR